MKNTKEKLLNEAIKLFAKHGFSGVSTRELVKAAGVNLCSINFYFGSKQALYDAVLDDVILRIQKAVETRNTKETEQLCALPLNEQIKLNLEKMFDFMCGADLSNAQAQILMREFLNPASGYDRFYENLFEPMHKRISELVATFLNLDKDNPQAVLLAHTLLGQLMMFKIHKEALIRRLDIKNYTPELLADMKATVLKNCDAILTAYKGGLQ